MSFQELVMNLYVAFDIIETFLLYMYFTLNVLSEFYCHTTIAVSDGVVVAALNAVGRCDHQAA